MTRSRSLIRSDTRGTAKGIHGRTLATPANFRTALP
jgi:hypothetical protein